MPFQPIVLTSVGDALILPEQSELWDPYQDEVEPIQDTPTDPESLNLGEYALTEMFASDPDAIGSPSYPQVIHLVGVHQECDGAFKLHSISKTHQALSCKNCYLRVVIPKRIKTYADLRTYAKNVLLADPLAEKRVRR